MSEQGEASSSSSEANYASGNYGDSPLIQSAEKISRKFTHVQGLDESKDQQEVLVRGRVHTSRGKGNICFLLLRQNAQTVQATLVKNEFVDKAMLKFATSIPRESIVDVEGSISKASVPSATQSTVEIQVKKLFVVSRSAALPVMIEDCARPRTVLDEQEKQVAAIEDEIKAATEAAANNPKDKKAAGQIEKLVKKKSEAQKFVVVNQDTRLDNRIIDLRTPANHAIFRLQSAVGLLFREYLSNEGFVEIHTPKLIAAASEGGAQVFKVQYFEGNAYLAQSPQLFKQMAVCSDLDRVFEVGPVFRAENAFTHRHMTEFTGLDLEMAFKDHYHEVLDVIDGLFIHIFSGLETKYKKELEIISQQYPFQPLKYEVPTRRFLFSEGVALLREKGIEIADFEDVNTTQEKALGAIVKEKYGTDFYILDQFPRAARPFYTMGNPKDERYTNSYDLFLRGEEISSGSQRIHDPQLLETSAKAYGVEMRTIQAYLNAFKFGAPPHGGCGVGLERVVMLYLGLNNIRKTSMFPRDPKRIEP